MVPLETEKLMIPSVGSLGANGALEEVNNVYVKDCSFSGTTNGARIKTWQGGSVYARNITFEKITLDAAKNPIIIDQFYCDRDHNCKSQASALSVDYVKYIDFEGTSASEEAIKLDCDQNSGCHNIIMDRIKITSAVPGKKIYASCRNAIGTSLGTTVPNVPCLKSGDKPTTSLPATPLPATPLPSPPLLVMPQPSPPVPATPPIALILPPPPTLPLPDMPPPAPPFPDTPPPSLPLPLPSPPLLATPPQSPPLPAMPHPSPRLSPPSPPLSATPPPASPMPASSSPTKPPPTLPLPAPPTPFKP
ncbi:PREDICTED: polygalacturonase-like [Prunus mume]|uniref:Polygalacturonase-like n=1 Tax=Prunus mume TaxID=102107 RepID=A0ABM0NQN5_PRUMU|nr:PREDICTED: polygalacturonase-like [Prunus mume]